MRIRAIDKMITCYTWEQRYSFTTIVFAGKFLESICLLQNKMLYFATVEEAVKYINSKRPNFLRRFLLVFLPECAGHFHVKLPAYCKLQIIEKTDGWQNVASKFMIYLGQTMENPIILKQDSQRH